MGDNVLDYLRAQFARMDDRFERKIDELTYCVGTVGTTMAGIALSMAHLSVRTDHLEKGLERVERRLDLHEVASQA